MEFFLFFFVMNLKLSPSFCKRRFEGSKTCIFFPVSFSKIRFIGGVTALEFVLRVFLYYEDVEIFKNVTMMNENLRSFTSAFLERILFDLLTVGPSK